MISFRKLQVIFICFAFSVAPAFGFEKSDWNGTWIGKWSGKTPAKVVIKNGRVAKYVSRGRKQRVGRTKLNRNSLSFGHGYGYKIELDPISKDVLSAFWKKGKQSASGILRRSTTIATEVPKQPVARPAAELGERIDDLKVVSLVQAELTRFGYKPGPVDGVIGASTKRAIAAFRRDSGLPSGKIITKKLLDTLGLPDWKHETHGTILAYQTRAKSLEKIIVAKSRLELISYLPRLRGDSVRNVRSSFNVPKSFVFIVYDAIEDGAIVETWVSGITDGRKNSWFNSFKYKIDETTPTEPLIIINEFGTPGPMFLVHKLFVNGKLIATRYTRASR